MPKKHRSGVPAAIAALPFGFAAGWLQLQGLLAADARLYWMLFWLAGALQLWLLTAAAPGRPARRKQQAQRQPAPPENRPAHAAAPRGYPVWQQPDAAARPYGDSRQPDADDPLYSDGWQQRLPNDAAPPHPVWQQPDTDSGPHKSSRQQSDADAAPGRPAWQPDMDAAPYSGSWQQQAAARQYPAADAAPYRHTARQRPAADGNPYSDTRQQPAARQTVSYSSAPAPQPCRFMPCGCCPLRDTPDVLAGLGPSLLSACGLCQLGALGGLMLQLPPLAAAAWTGGTLSGFIWLLLGLLQLACSWRDSM